MAMNSGMNHRNHKSCAPCGDSKDSFAGQTTKEISPVEIILSKSTKPKTPETHSCGDSILDKVCGPCSPAAEAKTRITYEEKLSNYLEALRGHISKSYEPSVDGGCGSQINNGCPPCSAKTDAAKITIDERILNIEPKSPDNSQG